MSASAGSSPRPANTEQMLVPAGTCAWTLISATRSIAGSLSTKTVAELVASATES